MKMLQVIFPAFQGKSSSVKLFLIQRLIASSDNTETLRDLGLDRGRISLASGRMSDIRPTAAPGDDTETFVFTVPPRDESELLDEEQADESVISAEGDVLYEAPEEEILGDLDEMDEDEVDNIAMQDPDATSSLEAADPETSILDTTLHEGDMRSAAKPKAARKKRMKLSKHGIEYPSLPAGVVKKLATSYARMAGNSKAKISKDTLDAIMQASDWFFEQVSGDLGAYAKHAGRKTIDESDIVTLMGRFVLPSPLIYIDHHLICIHRQRQTNATTTPFSLAQKHLPRELLQDLRMVPPSKLRKGKQLQRVEEEAEE